ncbi:unnamed protein product [Bursaphelenchus okinawaensis]|uniref:RING-type domain-containing protein n=1 Tax=Bursaphelenchus okinawaensis TaxID=465554 RepID=A0A811L3Y4_9BILA|nr:unnamed protein product [Bursaphelenchus okinawaensis]CAG9118934.1 unnamed protein product [Bursaphelenchus okinawaensis]
MPSAEHDKALKQFIECSICCNLMKDPRMLPCGHRLCFECCKSCCENDGGSTLMCPECRSRFGMDELIKDYSLMHFAEKMARMSTESEHEEPEKEEPKEEFNDTCSLCKKVIRSDKVYCCPKCPRHDAHLVEKLCSECVAQCHQYHDYVTRDKAQATATESLENAESDLRDLMSRFYEYRDRCYDKGDELNALLTDLHERCKNSQDIVKNDFKAEQIEHIDNFKACLASLATEISEFFNSSEEKWRQICDKTRALMLSKFGPTTSSGLNSSQGSTTNLNSAGTSVGTVAPPHNVFSSSTGTASRVSYGTKKYQQARKRGQMT